MKLKRFLRLLPYLCLAVLTAEILVRRWLWHQVPAPVSASMVYAVLFLNLSILAWRFLQPLVPSPEPRS